MSSSDSEDDCYGNVAQKLQSLKNKYVQEEIKDVKLSDLSKQVQSCKLLSKNDAITSVIALDDCNTTLNSTDNDELSLDAIIAQNSEAKTSRKRKSNEEPFEPVHERVTRSSRRKTANSRGRGNEKECPTDNNVTSVAESSSEAVSGPPRRGRRNRGSCATAIEANATPRARGRGRGNARGATPPRRRARGRSTRPAIASSYCPTYSVGNTDDYPDTCINQELFSRKGDDVQVIEDEDPLENDNEELSVKIYWQNSEVVRFKIRKYQRISPVFKYFSEKENVGNDKLLFMYNDKILKDDDTPDSINYNIAKFIDGGIVNRDVTDLLKQKGNKSKGGLNIKFQCQNIKKPFETSVRPEDKLALALMKCAEHLETPLERLKFYFDGDLLSGKSTPQELDLEGGECIDVKIVS